jgi:hypothetical protein
MTRIAIPSISLVFAFMAASCAGGDGGCPAGFVPQGKTCVAVEDVDPHENVVVPDSAPLDPGPKDTGPDLKDAGPDVPEVKDVPPDLPGPDAYPGGVIGLACAKDSECKNGGIDGLCLDWVKGYCTTLDCTTGTACPEGAVCLAMTPNKTACAASCTSPDTCRVAHGYGCKGLLDPSGSPVRVCYQIKLLKGPAEGCSGPQDCAGSQTCLTNFPGGYCATLFCDATHPCDAGTECVKVAGTTACLKTCGSDADCKVEGDLARACLALKSGLGTGDKVKVCASGTSGVAIGGQCLNDTECTSGACTVVFTGRCFFSKAGCHLDKDCTDGGTCVQGSQDAFGYCTQACSLNTPCKGQAYCVDATKAGGGGECTPGCVPDGPPGSGCRSEAGLACVFGDPIGQAGRYACVHLPARSVGTACKADSDCDSGKCFHSAEAEGTCTAACGYKQFCPFPTACETVSGVQACYRRCGSEHDCPGDMKCAAEQGALQAVCL